MLSCVFQASGGQRVTRVKKARGARLSQGEERVKKPPLMLSRPARLRPLA